MAGDPIREAGSMLAGMVKIGDERADESRTGKPSMSFRLPRIYVWIGLAILSWVLLIAIVVAVVRLL